MFQLSKTLDEAVTLVCYKTFLGPFFMTFFIVFSYC
jgi:hypothetical protein